MRRESYRVHRGGTPRFATERDQDDLGGSLVLAGEEKTPAAGRPGRARAIRIEARRWNNDGRLAIRREAIR